MVILPLLFLVFSTQATILLAWRSYRYHKETSVFAEQIMRQEIFAHALTFFVAEQLLQPECIPQTTEPIGITADLGNCLPTVHTAIVTLTPEQPNQYRIKTELLSASGAHTKESTLVVEKDRFTIQFKIDAFAKKS
jgi:hypothetical protein